jgi:hypothetical protein
VFTHTTWHQPTQGATWGASYRGVGIAIERLPDGWYVGTTEGGYHSLAYPDAQGALADVTAWIERQAQGVTR